MVKKAKKNNYLQPKKSNTMILVGVLLALASMSLLIYVVSEKIFHLA
tara:strand:+ start:127 stop:267 length:141 start_codon:yes stop_codon:yes gene_type:complete